MGRVASLLQLVAELEGRLASHEGGVVQPLLLEREREIQQLSAQVRLLLYVANFSGPFTHKCYDYYIKTKGATEV